MSTASAGSGSGSSGMLSASTLWRVVILLPSFILARLVANAIYRLYFHPLKNFPGPKLAAASRIPWNMAILKGTRDDVLREMHAKYGHFVRISPDELSCTEPNAWKDIYGHGTKGTPGSVPQKDWLKYGKSTNGSYNLLVARPEDHGRMRKIFNPAFSDRALKQQEPLFVKYADLLVTKLKEGIESNPEMKWDMVKMYNFTTFDVMGDLTFGEPLHMLSNAEYDPWVSIIFASIRAASHISILTAYPWLWKVFKAIVPESVNKRRVDHFQFAVDRVTKRLEKGRDSEGVDLWDLVLGQKEGRGLSRAEMDANASVFMIAGTETTATLLSGLTNLLLNHPDAMKKLTSEVRSSFPSIDDMTMEGLAALPYLAACIKEAFRLYPPVPLGLPRVAPETGSTVVGQFIPPNQSIAIPQHAMYTHKDNFKQPYEYIPERWLGDERFESDQRQCVQPFSIGTRDCVGKNMAYHEMRHIIGRVLYNFDLELCPESRGWEKQPTFILWEKKPLMCKLTAVR